MSDLVEIYNGLLEKFGIDTLIINFVAAIGIVIVYSKVIENFKTAKVKKNKQKKKVVSIVETFSMTAFFLLCYIFVIKNITITSFVIPIFIKYIACITYLIGVFINYYGRVFLGNNWGNNVVIYTDHTLVKNGLYNYIRHPLYSSIFLMLYSISIMYSNVFVAISTTLIFIPAMYYRAKQEEIELIINFGDEYIEYMRNTGMFIYKIRRKCKNESNS